MKKYLGMLLCVLLIIAMLGCDKNENIDESMSGNIKEHNATLTYDSSGEVLTIKSTATGAPGSYSSSYFQTAVSESDNIQYVELDTVMTIVFDTPPTKCEYYETILDSDGSVFSDWRDGRSSYDNLDDDMFSFYVYENLTVKLNSEEAKMTYTTSDTIIRGFRMACTWEDEYKIFYFVMKTDALSK